MKRILLLTLAWLAYESSYAQNITNNSNFDSRPITTTGISLPQLITTDLNRSKLQFTVNLSQGLNQPNVSANFQKFVSDSKKQFTLSGGAGISQSLSIRKNDNRDFYTFQGMHANLAADLKLFNKNDYFIQFGTKHSINKIGGVSDVDFINTYNDITLGFGKGRINFSNDGAAAMAIIEKLSKYGMLSRELTEEEYIELTEKIKDLKNRRKFVNRSFPLTETEEIQDLLLSYGVLPKAIDVIEIIEDVYRFEPIFDRTSGKQFSVSATGIYSTSNYFHDYNNYGIRANLSYSIHTPLSSKWQYNKAINGYLHASQSDIGDPDISEDIIKRVGLSISNDFHYLVDTKISYSLLSTVGYDFANKLNTFAPFGDPFYDRKGFYLNTKTELKYQISRTMSATFGISLNISPSNNFTGLHLGLNF